MHVQIAAADDDAVVADLYRWLREDPEVRQHSTIELVPWQVPAGAMGAAEVINMVLSQGFTALNLALAYASWRTARPAAPPITINLSSGSITVQDASEETVQRIVQALESAGTGWGAEERAGGRPAVEERGAE